MSNAALAQRIVEIASGPGPADSEVLEVSCGAGRILTALKERGRRVTGTNFGSYEDAPEDIPIRDGVSLLEGLPFDDASFDTVIAMEVIEHVENHRRAIAELGRVLRPGGRLILSFPNVHRVSSRISFLFSGLHKPKRKLVGFDIPIEKSFAFHNYVPLLPTFSYLLEAHGLRIEEFHGFHVKLKSLALYALLYIPGAISTAYRLLVRERHLKRTGHARVMRRWLMSQPVQCAENLIVVARKDREGTEATPEAEQHLPHWAK